MPKCQIELSKQIIKVDFCLYVKLNLFDIFKQISI